jgi:hypothetical protein
LARVGGRLFGEEKRRRGEERRGEQRRAEESRGEQRRAKERGEQSGWASRFVWVVGR